jgi:2-amino-4-hydroxy-6-hydroxymethyldihydropteridine diphosphokinase
VPRVYLGLGSNIEPEANIVFAVEELERRFGAVAVSPVYRAPAVGFESADFLNLVVAVETDLSPTELLAIIEEIHALAGRERIDGSKWVARPLDIDLLTYGDRVEPARPVRVPRDDILNYAFVLKPLSVLAPDDRHPQTGQSYAELWQAFSATDQKLEQVRVGGLNGRDDLLSKRDASDASPACD